MELFAQSPFKPDSKKNVDEKMSQSNDKLVELYNSLAQELAISIETVPSLDWLVNFSDNTTMPIHRWYYFKEGYSHQLVKKLLAEFVFKPNSRVLDPFLGSGSTLVSCYENKRIGIGVEINEEYCKLASLVFNFY